MQEKFALAKAISKKTGVTESDKVAKDMVTVFEANNLTIELIHAHISMEVKQAST